MSTVRTRRLGALLATSLLVAACSGGSPSEGGGGAGDQLAGAISIDGSSTVYPVTEAVAEEFQIANPGVKVTVAFSGTGGGFKKFCAGETDMNNASRHIKDEEAELCASGGVEYLELGVATDALSVVVNPANTWAACLTVDQLKSIWDEGSTVTKWSDVDPAFPAEPITLFGPGADSGTFDYFTEAINGKSKQSRADYTQSEDDNALVTGIAGDTYALGYFGFAYLEENLDKVRAVAVDGGSGCVEPSAASVADGTYTPLARPLYVYPSLASLQRPEMAAFMTYYLENVNAFVEDVGYIDATAEVLDASRAALDAALK
ncbi:MAG: hypothetical protein RL338_990 [Chloroflexota bacterium]|jgi:phosphate transport system substrate-binding protein